MPSITVQANQIGFLESINAGDGTTTDVDVSATFPTGSVIEIVFSDGAFGDDGNLNVDGDDIFITLLITETNGNVIEVPDIKLDLAPERVGDSFISTADAVKFTDSTGTEFDSQIIVVTNGSLSPGEEIIIEGDTRPDIDTNFNLCFEGATLISTDQGLKPAREIKAGDMVAVAHGRFEPVKWAIHQKHTINHMVQGQLPIFIKQNALGPNIPNRDTIVSGQHRIVVGADRQLQDSGLQDGIVAAKALTTLPGIRYAKGKTNIEWSNFAFDRHELVRANGAWMESLLLGAYAMRTFTPEQQQHLHQLYPDATPGKPLNGDPARTILKTGQFLRQARLHRQKAQESFAKNRKQAKA